MLKAVRIAIFLAFFACLSVLLGSCGPMDSLFPTAGNYKVNVQINDIPLNECSFARSSDSIRPYFEESVSKDPDVTALMVFLRDSTDAIVGWRVIYQLDENAEQKNTPAVKDESENDDDDSAESEKPSSAQNKSSDYVQVPAQYKNGDELIIPVKSLDKLPFFPIPHDLPMGSYTIVSNVMSDKDILQRIEKSFFYLSNAIFSYDGINAHLPGIAESNQLIPRGTIIMLEADLNFDNRLDPYIEWFNGRRKIAEGKVSDGAGYLFWKAPEESGFYSIRAIIYPVENFQDFTGYQKEISLLVSSKSLDIHLVSEDRPIKQGLQLMNWYIFEADLNDSKAPAEQAADRALTHSRNAPLWRASNGTYGAAAGNNNILSLPEVSENHENWQVLFRVKPENDGGIFSVQFGKTGDVFLHLYIDGSNLILTLTSPTGSVSQTFNMNTIYADDTSAEDVSSPEASADLDSLWLDFANEDNEEPDTLSDESADPASEIIRRNWGDSFLTVGIVFTIKPTSISAHLNIFENYIDSELTGSPISLKTEKQEEFQIMLGYLPENKKPVEDVADQTTPPRHEYTALWDEFALYRIN